MLASPDGDDPTRKLNKRAIYTEPRGELLRLSPTEHPKHDLNLFWVTHSFFGTKNSLQWRMQTEDAFWVRAEAGGKMRRLSHTTQSSAPVVVDLGVEPPPTATCFHGRRGADDDCEARGQRSPCALACLAAGRRLAARRRCRRSPTRSPELAGDVAGAACFVFVGKRSRIWCGGSTGWASPETKTEEQAAPDGGNWKSSFGFAVGEE
jgi:hypothetical protein